MAKSVPQEHVPARGSVDAHTSSRSVCATWIVVALLLVAAAGLIATTHVSPLIMVVAVIALNAIALQTVRRAVATRTSR